MVTSVRSLMRSGASFSALMAFVQLRHRRVVFVEQLRPLQQYRAHARRSAGHALHQLLVAHLERPHAHMLAGERSVRAYAHRQHGLAHLGARTDAVDTARLQAARPLVEQRDAGEQAAERVAGLVAGHHALPHAVQRVGGEHGVRGLRVEQRGQRGLHRRQVAGLRAFSADGAHPALRRIRLHQLGIRADRGPAWRVAGAVDHLVLVGDALPLHFRADRDDVQLGRAFRDLAHDPKHVPDQRSAKSSGLIMSATRQ
jgi:hypothetical protein